MDEQLARETAALIRSWDRFDRRTLAGYLIQDVEDPRINVQSILTRHFLARRLFGREFDTLMQHELRFALVCNWTLALLKRQICCHQLHAVLDALIADRRCAEGIPIPPYVRDTFAMLELPNYMCDLLMWEHPETTDHGLPDRVLSLFTRIWSQMLEGLNVHPIRVLEPACGSANDYRFIDACGLARHIDYTGFDLCAANIANARRMFPAVRFHQGNVLQIDAPDNAFEYCFVHDLFEHLSLSAMAAALAELSRVTRKGLCLSFFNTCDGPMHIEQPLREYHWNKLSPAALVATLEPFCSDIENVHIDTFLTETFGCPDTHNKNACTMIVHLAH